MPCGHILECADELPPTVREGAIQERRIAYVKEEIGNRDSSGGSSRRRSSSSHS